MEVRKRGRGDGRMEGWKREDWEVKGWKDGSQEEGKGGRLGRWRVLALHFLLLTGLKFYIYEEDGYG